MSAAGGKRTSCERVSSHQDATGHLIPRPALAHCSSWSPVAPLTPTPPVTLPSTVIGNPPGEAKTPGRVAVAGLPLLIASTKARVGRREVAAHLALPTARFHWFFWHSASTSAAIFFAPAALMSVP